MAQHTDGTTDASAADQTTSVDVHHLYRGDRSDEDRARDAYELRYEIRDGRQPTASELERLYDHVGTEIAPTTDTESILHGMWKQWNRGSGVESRTFLDAQVRSLEVGDVLVFDDTIYLCEPFGWGEITDVDAAVLGDGA